MPCAHLVGAMLNARPAERCTQRVRHGLPPDVFAFDGAGEPEPVTGVVFRDCVLKNHRMHRAGDDFAAFRFGGGWLNRAPSNL